MIKEVKSQPLWTGAELNSLFGASLNPSLEIKGVSIDSRQIKFGDLFVAIHGVSQDGHQYVGKACENGAAAVLVDHEIAGVSCPQIIVPDTLKALEQMAAFSRERTLGTVIAVTGSVGKTSTKEILAHTLAEFGSVSFSEASFNNHWGVPLSLARLPREAKFGIFEIGMNNPGEITPLVALVRPHISLITTIAPAHIGNMGGIAAIAKEKAAIYSGLVPNGTAIIPGDTEFCGFLAGEAIKSSPKQILSFGTTETADIRLADYQSTDQGGTFKVITSHQEIDIAFPLRGKHFAVNSLIAIAVGMSLNLDLNRLKKRLQTMPEIQSRGKIYKVTVDGQNITLIDDAYNANLVSMKAGIDVLVDYKSPKPGRKIAVIGEMLELGDFAKSHHAEIAAYLNSSPVDKVFAVGGESMEYGFSTLIADKQGKYVKTALEILPFLQAELQNGDVVFVKGSKGSKVSLVVDALLKMTSINSKVCVN